MNDLNFKWLDNLPLLHFKRAWLTNFLGNYFFFFFFLGHVFLRLMGL